MIIKSVPMNLHSIETILMQVKNKNNNHTTKKEKQEKVGVIVLGE